MTKLLCWGINMCYHVQSYVAMLFLGLTHRHCRHSTILYLPEVRKVIQKSFLYCFVLFKVTFVILGDLSNAFFSDLLLILTI